MPADDLPVRGGLVIPAAELSYHLSHAGGPGGQHVNKTASRVTLRWSVRESGVLSDAWRARLLQRLAPRLTRSGELMVHADGHRSQLDNKRAARERLVQLVREGLHVPKSRRATKPTRGSQRRRVDAKKRRGDTKRQRRRPGGDD
ncbi:MAG: aminoacyl-tRNA hydrolase [Planctomycetota bacterium]|nr:MAG: aminoacyl-tRNA hydrolase [Planctomycetota bacterium]